MVPINSSFRAWTKATNLHQCYGHETRLFFFILNDAFLHVERFPVAVQFHDTKKDNCIWQNVSYVHTRLALSDGC